MIEMMCSRTRRVALAIATAVALSSCAGIETATPPGELYAPAAAAFDAAEADVIAFRHDIHQYPELSGKEERTSARVAAQLEALGFDVRTGVGGYGVVGVLNGAAPGPVVAFRSDMDATAGDALDPVPYASRVDGVHHVCGHDVHTAVGIGLAHGYAAIRDRLGGSVMLVFQPAEERGTGAEAMLDDHVFGEMQPDSIFAVHTAPLPVGQLASAPGGFMAGRAMVEVRLSGDGDVAAAAAAVRRSLEEEVATVRGAEVMAPAPPDFISVDVAPPAVDADSGATIIRGFVMSAGLERRAPAEALVRERLSALSFAGVDMQVAYRQVLEGVNNDPEILAAATQAISAQAPDLNVLAMEQVIPMFSEDFGSFQRTVPGVMYFLGVNNPETGTVGMPHTPDYVADDAAIAVGVRAMLAASLAMLENE